MRPVITFLFLSVCIAPSFAQIGAKTQASGILGTWQNSDFGYQMTLILSTGGKGEFDGDAIAYVLTGSTLNVTQDGQTTAYQFVLKDNRLTLSGGDLEQPVTFTRAGATNNSTSAKTAQGDPGGSGLAGIWSGYNETIEFRDGQCVYQGQSYPYTVDAQQINVQGAQGNLVMGYRLEKDKLHLIINGQAFTYTRGVSSATSLSSSTSQAGRHIDQSLVGKWCYVNVTSTNTGGSSTDECITINGDGTYEYYSERSMSANTPSFSGGTASQNSDRGTWWVVGDRVHYQSQTQGAGSYQLVKRNHPKTGDAMIVLDGTAYVTYYNRAPW